MTAEGAADVDPGARRLMGSMLEHSGLPIERMPGLAAALEGFIAEAAKTIAPLIGRSPAAQFVAVAVIPQNGVIRRAGADIMAAFGGSYVHGHT